MNTSLCTSQTFWESRYKDNSGVQCSYHGVSSFKLYSRDIYDWYLGYEHIKDIIQGIVSKSGDVLFVGCGTSEMPALMHENGFHRIVCVDYSVSAINVMNERYQKEGLEFCQMDVRTMDFKGKKFDCIIDKATLDTIICSETFFTDIEKMLIRIGEVLKEDGIYIVVTGSDPDSRIPVFTKGRVKFDCQLHTISVEKDNIIKEYCVFVNRKRKGY